jgi:hypothetical protein
MAALSACAEDPFMLQPFRVSEQFWNDRRRPIAVRITRMERRTAVRKA